MIEENLVLKTEELTRRFDDLVAVNQLSFSVKESEVFGLVGPNGAGKSTLIKMLTTLLPSTSGKAWICGYDLFKQPAQVRHCIGYVPQLVSADGELTARENLELFAKLYDVPKAERADRIQNALAYMDLADVGDKRAREYSGGMLRRLEIAQSLLHRPKLLFLDEPTVGLDPIARTSVWRHILGLRDDYGTTILLTTHLMEEVEALCSRIGIMHQGQMVALGTSEELKTSTGDPNADLDDVFIYYAGAKIEDAGEFRQTRRARRNAGRLK